MIDDEELEKLANSAKLRGDLREQLRVLETEARERLNREGPVQPVDGEPSPGPRRLILLPRKKS